MYTSSKLSLILGLAAAFSILVGLVLASTFNHEGKLGEGETNADYAYLTGMADILADEWEESYGVEVDSWTVATVMENQWRLEVGRQTSVFGVKYSADQFRLVNVAVVERDGERIAILVDSQTGEELPHK